MARSDQITQQMRQTLFIGDAPAYPEWNDTKLRQECTDKLRSVFGDIVVKARGGYWLQSYNQLLTVGKANYRIPPRAFVQGLEGLELITDSDVVVTPTGGGLQLREVSVQEAMRWDPSYQGQPEAYTIQGDQVFLLPTPNTALTLRMRYYIVPSEIMQSQCSTLGGDGVDRGRVTAINTSTRVITVNVIPFDQSLAVPAAITSGTQRIDVVHPDGWHELALVGASQTYSGLNITVGGTDDLGEIAVGDYVRVQNQTDWPCIPDEFHRLLGDIAAVKVALAMSLDDKAAALSGLNSPDLERFRSLLTPRTKSQPKRVGIRPYGRR